MDAAHHLARQIIEGGDVELEHGKGDADDIGQMAPAAGAKAFRKPVLEIVEFDLDGLGALSLQHVVVPRPSATLIPSSRVPKSRVRGPKATVIASEAKQSMAPQAEGWIASSLRSSQ